MLKKPRKARYKAETPTLGWREYVSLPDLGISEIKVKVDTGARTSAIHAFDVRPWGKHHVRFSVAPRQRDSHYRIYATARLKERRKVRSSTGHETERPVIVTRMRLGNEVFEIELTLVNRDPMGFRMLLGRTAIKGKYLVDPGRSFQVSKSKTTKVKTKSKSRIKVKKTSKKKSSMKSKKTKKSSLPKATK